MIPAALRQRIDDILQALAGDEEAFNRFAAAEGLGVFMAKGRVYPSMLGQSHTARLARGLA